MVWRGSMGDRMSSVHRHVPWENFGRMRAGLVYAGLTSALLAVITMTAAIPTAAQDTTIVPPPSGVVPLPAPLGGDNPDRPLEAPPISPGANPAISGGVPEQTVTFSDDITQLPVPVRRMRDLIMDAARSGDPEQLRPLIGTGPNPTRLSLADIDGDPIEYFKSISGDAEGHEMLAILLEVFEAGYARFDEGQETELFVWPDFFAKPLDSLTAQERVALFKLVTAGDYEDMAAFGAYIFFRAGITPDGRWLFFVAGD